MTHSTWNRLDKIDLYADSLLDSEQDRYYHWVDKMLKKAGLDVDKYPNWDFEDLEWDTGKLSIYDKKGQLIEVIRASFDSYRVIA